MFLCTRIVTLNLVGTPRRGVRLGALPLSVALAGCDPTDIRFMGSNRAVTRTSAISQSTPKQLACVASESNVSVLTGQSVLGDEVMPKQAHRARWFASNSLPNSSR